MCVPMLGSVEYILFLACVVSFCFCCCNFVRFFKISSVPRTMILIVSQAREEVLLKETCVLCGGGFSSRVL